MASIKNRIKMLENAVKIQKERYVITRIIIDTDRTILGALRRDEIASYISVSEQELKNICADS